MPLQFIQGNITKSRANIIVNAANRHLAMGGGVCGAIFTAAGAYKLQKACDRIGQCETGKAVYTDGFDLCKYIIHTVGPVYTDGQQNEEQLLRSCYIESLKLAEELKVDSIAFPVISAGIYGYPKKQAFQVAKDTILNYLNNTEHELNVELYIYNGIEEYVEHNGALEDYLDLLVIPKPLCQAGRRNSEPVSHTLSFITSAPKAKHAEEPMIEADEEIMEVCCEACYDASSLEQELENLEESFSSSVMHIIDEYGWKDSEVYKRSNLTKSVFSNLRSDDNYQPTKSTALALAIGLHLDLDEAKELISKAGYALSNSNVTDMIVSYFIRNHSYDIFEVNEALFEHGQKCLGSK